jgi:hypothetical protein
LIHTIFDFWPFNMASGPEFLGFYFFLAFGGVLGAWVLRTIVAGRVDREVVIEPEPVPAPAGHGSPYRYDPTPPPPPRQRLTPG